jgi:hypothetical protein
VLVGGILTEGLGWEWVLWVNVPVALIALAFTPGLIPESRSESTTRHFDAAGAVTVTAGLTVLAVGGVGVDLRRANGAEDFLGEGALDHLGAVRARERAPPKSPLVHCASSG